MMLGDLWDMTPETLAHRREIRHRHLELKARIRRRDWIAGALITLGGWGVVFWVLMVAY